MRRLHPLDATALAVAEPRLRHVLRLDVGGDVPFQHLVAHPPIGTGFGVELLLLQVEAVLAINVADAAARLATGYASYPRHPFVSNGFSSGW